MMRLIVAVAIAAVALTSSLSTAMADRAPSAQERSQIEDVLRQAGFSRWGEIEFDDQRWEVDDAIGDDGKKYDLELDKTFNIVKRELDD